MQINLVEGAKLQGLACLGPLQGSKLGPYELGPHDIEITSKVNSSLTLKVISTYKCIIDEFGYVIKEMKF